MRIIICIFFMGLFTLLFSDQGFGQQAKKQDIVGEKNMFAKNEYFAKGGIGIIDKDLYIVVKSAKNNKNEMILSDRSKWTGLPVGIPEVAIFYDGRIWSPQTLPNRFDLSNAVVISFESDKIRFFDFRTMEGGYYKRIWTEK